MSDLFKRNISLDLNESQPEPWEAAAPEIPTVKRKIQVPGKGRNLSTFATELGQQLHDAQLYHRRDEIVLQKERTTEFKRIDPVEFVTWIEQFVECCEGTLNEDGSGTTIRSITPGTANMVLKSSQFRGALPFVRSCNQIRQPVLNQNGGLILLPAGYDAATQILTARGSTAYSLTMTLEQARKYLEGVLGEFCFADPEYGRAVQVAAMITAYGIGLLSETCTIPAFVYTANEAGAGKGLCVHLALIPVLGKEPPAATVKTHDEIGKWLFAAVRAKEKYLFLDNLSIELKDAWLEKFITSSQINGRVLGGSNNETHAKKTVLYITGNRITMGADMRRRSLVVESFLPTVRAEARQIQNPMDTQRILEVSPLLLACQYAMVREWVAANKPAPSRTHPSFVEWSRVIGGIVEHAGFACPIPVLTVAPDVDPVTASMERLVTEMRQENQPLGFTFREVVNLCKEHELFEDVVPSESAERKGNTEFGRLLKRYDHREFVDGWFFRIHGMGHAKRYSVFQQLEEAANPEPNQPEAQALAEPGPAEQTTTVATVDAEPPTLENSAQPQEQPLAA